MKSIFATILFVSSLASAKVIDCQYVQLIQTEATLNVSLIAGYASSHKLTYFKVGRPNQKALAYPVAFKIYSLGAQGGFTVENGIRGKVIDVKVSNGMSMKNLLGYYFGAEQGFTLMMGLNRRAVFNNSGIVLSGLSVNGLGFQANAISAEVMKISPDNRYPIGTDQQTYIEADSEFSWDDVLRCH